MRSLHVLSVPLLALVCLLAIGIHRHEDRQGPGLYALERLAGGPVRWRGVVTGSPQPYGRSLQALVEAQSLDLPAFRGTMALRLPPSRADFQIGNALEGRGWLRLPRPAAAPGSFDERAYLRTLGVGAYQSGSDTSVRILSNGSDGFWIRRVRLARDAATRFYLTRFPEPIGAVYAALVIGDRTGLDKRIKDAFIRAGVYHTLVVSGMNVAWFLWAVMTCLGLAGIPRRVSGTLGLVTALLYVAVVGGDPPAARAGIMVTLFAMARFLERGTAALNGLILSAAFALLWQPPLLYSLSFQLSYLATGGVLVAVELGAFFPAPRAPGKRFGWWAGQALLVSFFAQAAVYPILCGAFGRFPLIGFVSNLCLLPLVEAAFLAGLVTLAWGALGLPGLSWAAGATGWLGIAWVWMVNGFSRVSWATVPVDPFSRFGAIAYYALLLGACFGLRNWLEGKPRPKSYNSSHDPPIIVD